MPEEEIMFYDNENREYITNKSLIREMRAERRRQLLFRRIAKKLLTCAVLILMPIAGWLLFSEPEVLICELCAAPLAVAYFIEM